MTAGCSGAESPLRARWACLPTSAPSPLPGWASGSTSDRLLTARELGEYLGLRPGTVLDKWERGELPGFRFGRVVRFDLHEVLAEGRGQGPGDARRSASNPIANARPEVLVWQSRANPDTRGKDNDA
jgi:excisionase family DNA binding protein